MFLVCVFRECSVCGTSQNWTLVCPLDSDGDGLTNGQELGDPRCEWTPGSASAESVNISHPGPCNSIRA